MNNQLEGNFVIMPAQNYELLMTKVDGIAEYLDFLKKSDDRLITTEQLLGFISISKSTLQHYRDKKLIRFRQSGRKILYSLAEVQEDLKAMNKL